MLPDLLYSLLMWRSLFPRSLFVVSLVVMISLSGCFAMPLFGQIPTCPDPSPNPNNPLAALSLPQPSPNLQVLRQSWVAYRRQFIQDDGRVIDREADDRSTSEGQAYAMLRAVMINDRDTFSRTLIWAETNLARNDQKGRRIDQLWAWKWGNTGNSWEILDANFASDADIDAVTALILAARRWGCSGYLTLARLKLNDIWKYSTAEVGGKRYLLPGPAAAFWNQPNQLILNPSYFAPYAFRLFAQVDSGHNWMSLVDSSYRSLKASSAISKVKLPSDWLVLNPQTGKYSALPASHQLKSVYSFDAYRVWWRIALDATWYQSPSAKRFLKQNTAHLKQLWQKQQKIPARIDLQGRPTVNYEATSQYAALYTAFQITDSKLAQQIYQRKLMAKYRNGFWDNDKAYYTQNLAWFALLPASPPRQLLSNHPHSFKLSLTLPSSLIPFGTPNS
jgi:endoglucanase